MRLASQEHGPDPAQVGFEVELPPPEAEMEAERFVQEQYRLGDSSMMLDAHCLSEAKDDGDITGALPGTYTRELVGGDHSGALPDDYHPAEVPVVPRARVLEK